jgi:hypothetical protein
MVISDLELNIQKKGAKKNLNSKTYFLGIFSFFLEKKDYLFINFTFYEIFLQIWSRINLVFFNA